MKGDVNMKKLTKKQKAELPQFIVSLDLLANSTLKELGGCKLRPVCASGYIDIPLKSADILGAMREAEAYIQQAGNGQVYLADIMRRTDEFEAGEIGDVTCVYEEVLRTRVNDGWDKPQPANWHFCDAEHHEGTWNRRYGVYKGMFEYYECWEVR